MVINDMIHNINFKWCFNEYEKIDPFWVKMGENVTKLTEYRDN